MSREEQIKWLRRLLKSREDPRGDTEIDVALKCAIEALEKEPCEDCIRRSDIGLTDFEIIMCNGDYREGLKILLEKIAAAPSVTPMQKWIPVSERTPDSDSKVLVSTRYEDWNKVVYDVDIAYYAGDNEWAADENCDRYDNTNFIVAWMPLPEPYKLEIPTDQKGANE